MATMLTPLIERPDVSVESFALLFHAVSMERECDLLITRHPVTSATGQSRIGAGVAFSSGDLATLVDLLAGKETAAPLLPYNVIGYTPTSLCWYVPGKVRPMWFTGKKASLKLNVPWPNLLFSVNNGKLSVMAYKKNRRPTASTRLYHAPLANIYASSSVCTGNAKLPTDNSFASMREWEAVIFDTLFSHINHEATLTLTTPKGKAKRVSTADHVRFWKGLDRKGDASGVSRFPADMLVPLGRTLERHLVALSRGY